MAWRKHGHHVAAITSPFTLYPQHGMNSCYIALLPSVRKKHIFACRLDHSGVFVGSPPHKMQRAATALLCKVKQNVISQVILQSERQRLLAQSVGIVFRKFFPPSAVQVVPLVTGWAFDIIRLMCNGMCASRRSMLKMKTNIVDWGAKMGLIVFAITTSAHAAQPLAPSSGGLQVFGYDTSSYHTTSSNKPPAEVSNMGSLYWASSTLLCMHTTIIVRTKRT